MASLELVVAIGLAVIVVAAHALGMPWGPAWVLGAAVAPTDATAVSVLGGVLPRRLAETLRAESLVNDGTALVVYGLALAVTAEGEELTPARLGLMVLVSYGGGIVAGRVVSWLAIQVRCRLQDPEQHALLALLAPLSAWARQAWLPGWSPPPRCRSPWWEPAVCGSSARPTATSPPPRTR